jgi:hypothetical protein
MPAISAAEPCAAGLDPHLGVGYYGHPGALMRPAVAMDTGDFRQFPFGDVISPTHQQPLVPMVWAADTAGLVGSWPMPPDRCVAMVTGMGWDGIHSPIRSYP